MPKNYPFVDPRISVKKGLRKVKSIYSDEKQGKIFKTSDIRSQQINRVKINYEAIKFDEISESEIKVTYSQDINPVKIAARLREKLSFYRHKNFIEFLLVTVDKGTVFIRVKNGKVLPPKTSLMDFLEPFINACHTKLSEIDLSQIQFKKIAPNQVEVVEQGDRSFKPLSELLRSRVRKDGKFTLSIVKGVITVKPNQDQCLPADFDVLDCLYSFCQSDQSILPKESSMTSCASSKEVKIIERDRAALKGNANASIESLETALFCDSNDFQSDFFLEKPIEDIQALNNYLVNLIADPLSKKEPNQQVLQKTGIVSTPTNSGRSITFSPSFFEDQGQEKIKRKRKADAEPEYSHGFFPQSASFRSSLVPSQGKKNKNSNQRVNLSKYFMV
ncbi:hypothetical protein [Legionella fairfieldensis]|uniref:hypothetical protein n=1 Tax=Legionella fairfieldensis TaxID=45064 RepID=UPI00048E82E9|nr:hypothetical protein [Legionella fairfieldensis]